MRAVAAGLAFVAGCATSAPAARATAVGAAVVIGDAGPVSLAELAGGRPLVIDLFATWCEPCRAQLLELDAFARRAPGDVLAIAVDVGEDAATVERFIRRLGVTVPVYLDPRLTFSDGLGETSVPRLLVVDRAGRIVHRGTELDDAARAAIEAAAVAP
jgi:thiol-disulfide isomerase/thioredoxin